jgi:SAM-dependent methyltransferase
MRTKILPDPLLDLVKKSPYVYGPARKLRMGVGSRVPPRHFDGIRGRIHMNDFMLEGTSPEGVAKYRQGAENVIAFVSRGLDEAGRSWDDIRAWLDFGCGYGRIVRALLDRVDPAKVYVTDVITEGVEFCASEFGVHPVPSAADVATLKLPRVDYAYAISVLTHLPELRGRELMHVLGEAVEPGGILLFTIQGQWALDNAEWYSSEYTGELKRELTQSVAERGVGYIPYRHYRGDDYGMTWHSKSYVLDAMAQIHSSRFELLFHDPRGLDQHQDVFAFRRVT